MDRAQISWEKHSFQISQFLTNKLKNFSMLYLGKIYTNNTFNIN